jgi:CHAD domain-containing protein
MVPSTTEISPLSEFVYHTLQINLASITAEIDGVLENNDIEYIHRIRIAVRRYRNSLQIFQRFGNENLSTIFDSYINLSEPLAWLLADARDLDIQRLLVDLHFQTVSGSAKEHLIFQLQKDRQNIQALLAAHFADEMYNQLYYKIQMELAEIILTPLGHIPSSTNNTLPAKTICSITTQALSMLYILDERANFDEIHHFRKIIRRLRYTLECFEGYFDFLLQPMIETCHQLQDLLGDLHDLDLLRLTILQTQPLMDSDSEQMLQIIDTAREPLQGFFMHACNSGEIMRFLYALLNLFNKEISIQIGKN